jgi:hypothetical protein
MATDDDATGSNKPQHYKIRGPSSTSCGVGGPVEIGLARKNRGTETMNNPEALHLKR